MRGPSLRVVSWLLGSLVVACAPVPSPSPSLTPPPLPAEFVPWPDIVWQIADLPIRPLELSAERVVAVTATDAGFVAVGYRETDGVRDGKVWRSTDAETWELVDDAAFAGVDLVDVSPAPKGFVALGVEGRVEDGGGHPTAAVFGSLDGESWQRLPPLPATGDTDPIGIAGGPQGVIAIAFEQTGRMAVWRAADGRSFERVSLTGPAARGLVDPHAVPDGFVAIAASAPPPSMLRSVDGLTWTAAQIDAGTDANAIRLFPGRWGLVAQGISSSTCTAPCPVSFVGWWSGDGGTWGPLPVIGSPIANGVSVVVPAGDHGLLAIDGADAWASPDGWAWRSLPEPGDGTVSIDDAVVRGDVIVAVGGEAQDDGSSIGRILVAR